MNLPFPKPLARSAFLEPDFDPASFLANLSDRYQTLDDLRSELRDLDQSLSKELLDLVNDNYHDFLSLGSSLRGGEERVEEIRVGLLGFQRDLALIQDRVKQRQTTIAALICEKRELMKDIRKGKSLLEIAGKIEDLETSLLIGATIAPQGNGVEPEEFSDDSDEDAEETICRLKRHTEQYLVLTQLLRQQRASQPYINSQADRIAQIKSMITLDVEGTLKQLELSSGRGQQVESEKVDLQNMLATVDETWQFKSAK